MNYNKMNYGTTYEVCCYLNYFDMLNVSKLFEHELIQSIFTPEHYINQRLEYMGINSKEFNTSLVRSKSLIAGSFPLQCLLGEYWDSDVDIYNDTINIHDQLYSHPDHEWLKETFQTKNNKIVINRLIGNRDVTSADYQEPINDNIKMMDNKCCYRHLNIDYLIDMKINDIPCQWIFHHKSSVDRKWFDVPSHEREGFDIFDYFDLEFCKLKYDGIKLHMIPDMNIIEKKKYTLTKAYVNHIFDKCICVADYPRAEYENNYKMNKDEYMRLIAKRVSKYRKRGFEIEIIETQTS